MFCLSSSIHLHVRCNSMWHSNYMLCAYMSMSEEVAEGSTSDRVASCTHCHLLWGRSHWGDTRCKFLCKELERCKFSPLLPECSITGSQVMEWSQFPISPLPWWMEEHKKAPSLNTFNSQSWIHGGSEYGRIPGYNEVWWALVSIPALKNACGGALIHVMLQAF